MIIWINEEIYYNSPKVSLTFNIIQIKIPAGFLKEFDRSMQKWMWNKRALNHKNITDIFEKEEMSL